MKLTEALSVYAAVLSTIVLFWNIRRAIPRFEVEVVSSIDEVDGKYVFGAYISVKNPSPHTVHLSSIDILYFSEDVSAYQRLKHFVKYRRSPASLGWVFSSLSNHGVDYKCPVALEAGKSIGILVPSEVLEEIFKTSASREIKASAQDELWRRKNSRKFSFPKDDV